MAGPSRPEPSAEIIRAAKQTILQSLSDEMIVALASLLIAETPRTSEHSNTGPEKECAICNYTCGEQRDDGTMEVIVTLPCNHSFGMRCLAKACQRVQTCPMCRGPIPGPIVQDFAAIYRKQQDAKQGHHLGSACEHQLAFDGPEYLPEDAEDMQLGRPATSFDYEFALPHDSTAGWTFLLCPHVTPEQRVEGTRKAHMDEVVVAIDAALAPIGLQNCASKFVYGVWFGPQSTACGHAKNTVALSTSRDKNGAFVDAAVKALKDVEDSLRTRVLLSGGRIVLKTQSAYFDDVFTETLDTWQHNGFTNLQGRPARNKQFWQPLSKIIERLRIQHQTTVHSWLVDDVDILPLASLIRATTWTWCERTQSNNVSMKKGLALAERLWSEQRTDHFRQYATPTWLLRQELRNAGGLDNSAPQDILALEPSTQSVELE